MIGPVYLAEMAPAKLRGSLNVIFQLFVSFACLPYASFVARAHTSQVPALFPSGLLSASPIVPEHRTHNLYLGIS